MTSASELFNNRRHRFGRNSEVADFDSSSGAGDSLSSYHDRRRHGHHSHGARRRHHDGDTSDVPRRSETHISRRATLEREFVRFDTGGGSSSSRFIPANVDLELLRSIPSIPMRERFIRTDRLPGDVLLARERLLERLRGIQLSGQRGNVTAAPLPWQANARDIEVWRMFTGLVSAARSESATRSNSDMGSSESATRSNSDVGSFIAPVAPKPRPLGLTRDEFDLLHIEVFTTTEKSDEENISRASLECSICLENFVEGTELVCLPCGHKYHRYCLFPWVQACGDCPYCRAAIIVVDTELKL